MKKNVSVFILVAIAGLLAKVTVASDEYYVSRYAPDGIFRIDSDGAVLWSNTNDVAKPRGFVMKPGARELLVVNCVNSYGAYGNIKRFRRDDGAYLGDFATSLYDPMDLAITNGYLYVSLNGTGNVRRYDLATGALDSGFNVAVPSARGMEFGPDGRLYASSYSDNCVYAIDLTTTTRTSFVSMTGPVDLAWKGTNLYVVKLGVTPNVVQKYDSTGAYVGDFLTYYSIYTSIAGICFGPSNSFFNLDYGAGDIFKYIDNGTNAVSRQTFATIGVYGSSCGMYHYEYIPPPRGMVISIR